MKVNAYALVSWRVICGRSELKFCLIFSILMSAIMERYEL
jgi:hypothetical protein